MSFKDKVVVFRLIRSLRQNYSLSNQLDNIFFSNSSFLEHTLYYSDHDIDYFEKILDPKERSRIPNESHRKSTFILSHGALRYFLARYLCISPESIVYSYSNYGKPFIHGSNIQFSLSRRGNYFAFFFSAVNCGIDIEISRPLNFIGISKLFFNAIEISEIENQMSNSVSQHTFFNIWVKKEAMIKAVGLNLEYLKVSDTINTEINIDGVTHQHNILSYHSSFYKVYVASSSLVKTS